MKIRPGPYGNRAGDTCYQPGTISCRRICPELKPRGVPAGMAPKLDTYNRPSDPNVMPAGTTNLRHRRLLIDWDEVAPATLAMFRYRRQTKSIASPSSSDSIDDRPPAGAEQKIRSLRSSSASVRHDWRKPWLGRVVRVWLSEHLLGLPTFLVCRSRLLLDHIF